MLNRKIKIAFLMQESRMGGAEFNALAMAEGLDKDKFEIYFICPRHGKLIEKCEEFKIPYHIIRCPKFFSTSFQFGERMVILNPFALIYDIFIVIFLGIKYKAFFTKLNFDIISTKGILANFYGSLSKIGSDMKCVWDMQEVIDKKRALGLLRLAADMGAYFFADHIIAASKAIRDQFRAPVWKKIDIVYNGVSFKKFDPRKTSGIKIRKEFNIRNEQIIIGHIARFTYWKGQLDFIRAADLIHKRYPEVVFFLVGDSVFENSNYKELLIKNIKKYNLQDKIILPGFREDIPDILAAIDIFVHSSIEAEGCPLTVIYAMAMEKAIIATDVPGTNEVIFSKEGVLVPPASPGYIAEAIDGLISPPARRKELGKIARKKAMELFSIEKSILETENIFLRLQNA